MIQAEAEQIGAAINLIRPDWPAKQVVTILGRSHAHRPARDAMLALVWVAYDPDTIAPGRIDVDGPWWHITRLAGVDTDPTPTPLGWCSLHRCEDSTRNPCRHCLVDHAQALHDADEIKRIRAAARTQADTETPEEPADADA